MPGYPLKQEAALSAALLPDAAIVNRELGHGHGRQDITATYIGRRN